MHDDTKRIDEARRMLAQVTENLSLLQHLAGTDNYEDKAAAAKATAWAARSLADLMDMFHVTDAGRARRQAEIAAGAR